MSKIIIDELLDETSFLSDVNDRFKQVEDELNDKVLYRNNPENEPNGMFNDLDMQENDILNVNSMDVNKITIQGIDLGVPGDLTWGDLTGSIPDQADLEARLQQAEDAGVSTVSISEARLTNLGLEAIIDVDGNVLISHTERVNAAFGGLVRLNQSGLIDINLTEIGLVNVLGFFRGDDQCPKPIDNGDFFPPYPITPCPGAGLDFRNPTEIFGEVFSNGDAYLLSINTPDIDGQINLINEADPVGPLVPTTVVEGDGIVYMDELILGTVVVVQAGWRLWAGAVKQSTAAATIYDPTAVPVDLIIDPLSTNVDLALNDLDKDADLSKTHREIASGNPHNVTIGEIGAEPANTNIQLHIADITNNPHSVDKVDVGLGNAEDTSDLNKPISTATQAALDGKQDKSGMALGTVGSAQGLTRYEYDADTNTLTILTTVLP